MLNKFKLWGETNHSIAESIQPTIGLRDWNELEKKEKHKIFLHLDRHKIFDDEKIWMTITRLNEIHKRQSYGKTLLEHGGPHHRSRYPYYIQDCCLKTAKTDFVKIFMEDDQNVFFEMLSLYAANYIDGDSYEKAVKGEQVEENIKNAYSQFDRIKEIINDVFEQFGINVLLTRDSFIPKQDSHIIHEIYIPVLNYLTNPKWENVNRDLRDAFTEYQQRTKNGYSSCITHAVTALQGFLQILVNGKTGKGKISDLIKTASKDKIIPNDEFSVGVFNDIESHLMKERQLTGDPHPKKEYANEKSARLVLNLLMVFIQHCIQYE
jgi:hypothetical protein